MPLFLPILGRRECRMWHGMGRSLPNIPYALLLKAWPEHEWLASIFMSAMEAGRILISAQGHWHERHLHPENRWAGPGIQACTFAFPSRCGGCLEGSGVQDSVASEMVVRREAVAGFFRGRLDAGSGLQGTMWTNACAGFGPAFFYPVTPASCAWRSAQYDERTIGPQAAFLKPIFSASVSNILKVSGWT